MSRLVAQRDLEFLLYQVFGAEQLTAYPRYAEYDRESFSHILSTAEGVAEDYFLPHFQKADANEPHFDGQRVTTIAELKVAWQKFADTGLLSARQDYEHGGMQLPALIHMACNAYFMAANPASAAYPFLTSAAANVIQAFGSAEQQQLYLPAMLDGRFAGTMALTEPDVGSSLGDLTTKAVKHSDSNYRIKGQKMYISGGDQDLTENIVHLVLARIDGAPVGVKGISMFIVPKFRLHHDGASAERNDVQLAGLLHKMGYRGTTSTVLSFGEQDDCHGYLVGEAGQGLSYMFKMMNEARIGVGLGAAMIGYRGYLESLAYAKDRPQGRAPTNKDPASKPLAIIEHADVKRMLLQQKAYVEGGLALCLLAARLVDDHEANQDEDAGILLDLLTPIVKSYPSYYGPKANDLAIQVLGGAGYIREYPVEQLYRDNRLNPIHEGTHGIQSLDLLGRKLWQHQGRGQKLLFQRIQATLQQAQQHPKLQPLCAQYSQSLQKFMHTMLTLGEQLQQGQVDKALANSAVFLDVMSQYVVGWLWLEMAQHALASCSADAPWLQGKLHAARYQIEWELPLAEAQLPQLQSCNDSWASMQRDWF
jgi:alkylation response protein AidB-like acyl-CoA dehydrogenase